MRESAYKKIFNVEERQLSPESTQEKKEENIFSSRQHDVLRPWTLSTALPVKKKPKRVLSPLLHSLLLLYLLHSSNRQREKTFFYLRAGAVST